MSPPTDDLAQFVSDYLRAVGQEGYDPTATEIAEAYADRANIQVTDQLLQNVRYYLG